MEHKAIPSSTTKGTGKAASMAPRTFLLSKAAAAQKQPVLVSPLPCESKPIAGLQQESPLQGYPLLQGKDYDTNWFRNAAELVPIPLLCRAPVPLGTGILVTSSNHSKPLCKCSQIPRQVARGLSPGTGTSPLISSLVPQGRVCTVAVSPGRVHCPRIPKLVSLQ